MIKVSFIPKTDTEEYLNNDFNLEIFKDLTENEDWQGTFEPLEFLNLLYEQFEIINANKAKPLSVKTHLLKLDLEKHQLYYFLYFLKLLIYTEAGMHLWGQPKDKPLSICHDFIEKEFDKLEKELYPEVESENEKPVNRYDFEKVKKHIETLPDAKAKIKYLIEIKTGYKQEIGYEWNYPNFGQKCELEIKKLNEILQLEAHTATSKTKPVFQLSKKMGSKIELIRVLNALYEIHLLEKTDGQRPSKQEFIGTMGEYLGVDLSNYHSNLSQALQNQPLETNLKVFEDMKAVTTRAHYNTKNR